MRPNLDRVLTLGALSAFLYGTGAAASHLYPVLEVLFLICAMCTGVVALALYVYSLS
jgi:hypothetical protein